MERQQRTRLTTVLVLALVFATGVVVGLAVDRVPVGPEATDGAMASASVEESGDAEEEGEPRRERQPMWERVGGLTPDQEIRIDSIMEQYRAAREAISEGWRADYEPLEREREAWEEEHVEPLRRKWSERFDSLVRSTRGEIKDVMTSEQAQRYDSLLADYERRREARRRDRDSGGRD